MKYPLSFLCILLILSAKSQNQVAIKATITGLDEGTKVWLVPENGETWRDSVLVSNASFEFHRKISKETQYSIHLTREPENGKWWTFYVNKGVIIIKASNGNFNNVTISGSKYAVDFNDYNIFLRSKNDNKPLLANNYLEFKTLDSLKAIWTRQWILNHLTSPISTYEMYVFLKNKIAYNETEDMMNKLSNSAKETIYWSYLKDYIDAPNLISVGKDAPNFSQTDTLNKMVSLKDFRGKYVLVDFWASWCVPCRAENPNLVKTFKKYMDRNFTIISISLDNDWYRWIEAINKDSLTWTHISDLKYWDNSIVKKYAIESVPSNLLLDPNGKIVAINLRGDNLEKKLAEIYK